MTITFDLAEVPAWLIPDDGSPGVEGICGWSDGQNTCEEPGAYSLKREDGLWYALCVTHTAEGRHILPDVTKVTELRPHIVGDDWPMPC